MAIISHIFADVLDFLIRLIKKDGRSGLVSVTLTTGFFVGLHVVVRWRIVICNRSRTKEQSMLGYLPFLKKYLAAGIMIASLFMVGCWQVKQAEAQEVEGAMQAFLQAMLNKNAPAIFAAFSQQSAWKYQPYDISTGRPLPPKTITPKELGRDFQQKSGWYNFFMEDPDGYTFRVNFIHRQPWKKRGSETFVAPDSSTGNTYITWRREGQKWVIAEIGETTP
jgi:hypothetical protein